MCKSFLSRCGLAILAASCVATAHAQFGTWEYKAHMLTPRQGLCAATGRDGRILAFGGSDLFGISLFSAEAYDPTTDAWSAISSMPDARTNGSAVTAPNGFTYLFGGYTSDPSQNTPDISVDMYDVATDTWTTVNALPQNMSDARAAVGNDGKIYIFTTDGGTAGYSYDPSTNSFTQLLDVPKLHAECGVATGPDGLIYLFGGIGLGIVSTDVFTYDAKADVWGTGLPLSAGRYELSAASAGDQRVYAIGGNSGPSAFIQSDVVDAIDPSVPASQPAQSLLTAVDSIACATGPHGEIYALGGTDLNGNVRDIVQQYTPVLLHGSGDDFATTQGVEYNGSIAHFTDGDLTQSAFDFTATIDWGDGTAPTTGAIVADTNPGTYKVTGSHTYEAVGKTGLKVTISDADGESITLLFTTEVQDNPVTGSAIDINTSAGVKFSGIIGKFGNGTFGQSSQFTAFVGWGDGGSDTGTIVDDPAGGYDVVDSHTYVTPGAYSCGFKLVDADGGPLYTHASATVTEPPASITGININSTEGAQFSGNVAGFTDGDPSLTATSFTAQISWGDGVTSTGSVTSNGGGGFYVSGTHTYLEEGSYSVSVAVTINGGSTGNGSSVASVADAPLTASGFSLTAKNRVFSGTVATFKDGNPNATVAEFSARIYWGDGAMSIGKITKGGGLFSVSGSHTYLKKGRFVVTISIGDVGGSSVTTTTAMNAGPVK